MARKNRRGDRFTPVDYTGIAIPLNIPTLRTSGRETREEYEARWDARRKREERQRKARIADGLDWSICMVVGCGEGLTLFRGSAQNPHHRDPDLELPMCHRHLGVAFKTAVHTVGNVPEFIEAVVDINAAVAAREKSEDQAAQRAFMAREDGDIYFIRLGELVKVGWTRDLWSRVKSYGASAELLVSYAGTRQDETNLHRQLTPARAKGREWYEDGAIIAKFVDEALKQYGMPPTFEDMWTTPKRVVAGKRAMRYRQ